MKDVFSIYLYLVILCAIIGGINAYIGGIQGRLKRSPKIGLGILSPPKDELKSKKPRDFPKHFLQKYVSLPLPSIFRTQNPLRTNKGVVPLSHEERDTPNRPYLARQVRRKLSEVSVPSNWKYPGLPSSVFRSKDWLSRR